MNAREGHSTLVMVLDKTMSDNDLGQKMSGNSTHIVQGMGLAQVIDLVKTHEPHMMEAVMALKEKEVLSAFPTPAFEQVTVADFQQGCDLQKESSYAEFAKDKNLDTAPLKEIGGAPAYRPLAHRNTCKSWPPKGAHMCHNYSQENIGALHLPSGWSIWVYGVIFPP